MCSLANLLMLIEKLSQLPCGVTAKVTARCKRAALADNRNKIISTASFSRTLSPPPPRSLCVTTALIEVNTYQDILAAAEIVGAHLHHNEGVSSPHTSSIFSFSSRSLPRHLNDSPPLRWNPSQTPIKNNEMAIFTACYLKTIHITQGPPSRD